MSFLSVHHKESQQLPQIKWPDTATAAGWPRSSHLRSFLLNDLNFTRLCGLHEGTDSMHNDYKSRLVKCKIRNCVDVSEFLGQWEPPERARRRKAA